MQLALFDFDNTLTRCDTYARYLRRLATPAQLAQARWKLGPWLLGYRTGLVSAAAIRARVTGFAFAQADPEHARMHAEAFARQVLPGVLDAATMRRLRWHQEQGHEVAVVSGSLDLYLRPWCAEHGIATTLCNALETAADGRLSGRYRGPDIAADKARHIQAHFQLSRYRRIHAYGDSREDRPMLALAHERWYRGQRLA